MSEVNEFTSSSDDDELDQHAQNSQTRGNSENNDKLVFNTSPSQV